VTKFCEHGNETLCAMNGGESSKHMSHCQRVKRDSTSSRWFVAYSSIR
jgi:hypothetical protein